MEEYDILVIGGGTAGMNASALAKAAGARRVALIEKDRLGGT